MIKEEFNARFAKAMYEEVDANVKAAIRETEGNINSTKEGKKLIYDSFVAGFEQKIADLGLTKENADYLNKMADLRSKEIFGEDGKTINEQHLKAWIENTQKMVKGMLWSAGINAAGNIVNSVTGAVLKNAMSKQAVS